MVDVLNVLSTFSIVGILLVSTVPADGGGVSSVIIIPLTILDGIPLTEKYAGSDIKFSNKIKVSTPGMYNIISSETSITRTMEIKVEGKGFQAFTFTFG